MKVLICGGGTAGHLFPGIALAQELKKIDRSVVVVFVGSEGGLEQTLVPEAGYAIRLLPIKGMPRRRPLAMVGFLWRLLRSLAVATQLIRAEKPDLIVGMGGFASFPVLVLAPLFRIPSLIHEQNSVPGVVTRIASRFATVVALSYRQSRRFLKRGRGVEVTGNPLRENLHRPVDRTHAASALGLDPGVATALVFGGSRGAKRINDAVIEAFPMLSGEPIQLIHVTGSDEYLRVSEEISKHMAQVEVDGGEPAVKYVSFPFYQQIEELYAVSDLVIGRAGASTIAEITALGKPSVLIPYPHATDDHQLRNAELLAGEGAAEIVLDSELSGERLYSELIRLCGDRALLDRMSAASLEYGKPKAGGELARLAYGLVEAKARRTRGVG